MNEAFKELIRERKYGDLMMETDHWLICLAPNQSNIGTSVVALKRHYGTLDGLKNEEWLDFADIVQKMEYSLKKSFKATMFNWGALMNADYITENPDPHIHWHFIPRYKHDVHFEGLLFQDKYFGSMHPRPERELQTGIRKRIMERIIENMEKE